MVRRRGGGSRVPRSRATARPGKNITDRTPAPMSAAAFSGSMWPVSRPTVASATSRGSEVAVSSIIWTRSSHRQVAAVEDERGKAAHRQQQHEEGDQAQRCLPDRGQVQAHAGGDEEDRDEEAVPDGVQLVLQGRHVAGGPAAQDHAGEERAEHHVEADVAGEHQQAEEEHQGEPERDLRRRVLALAGDRLDPRQPSQSWQPRETQRDRAHRQRGRSGRPGDPASRGRSRCRRWAGTRPRLRQA